MNTLCISQKLSKVTPSVTLAISAQAKKMKEEGLPVIGFGAGEPDFDTPDYIKKAAIEAIEQGFTKYTPAAGTLELKQAICDKLKNDNGLSYEPNQVVVSCGAKHTIYNVLQVLLNPGDEVLIPAPFWLSYPEMVKLADGTPVVISAGDDKGFKIDPSDLDAHLTDKTKVLILNSPSNPTGAVYSPEELKAIADWAKSKNLWVISDEIYEQIVYGVEHVSIASLSPELYDKTIVVNGHSKVYSMTGWRVGYMAGDASVAKAVSSLQSHSTSNPCSIAQKAAVAALVGDQSWIAPIVGEFQKRRDVIVERLNAMPGVSCNMPQGAFYVFPNIAGLNRGSAMQVCEGLLKEANVAAVPGEAFAAPNNIRLSYATSLDVIEEGLDRIEQWVNKEN